MQDKNTLEQACVGYFCELSILLREGRILFKLLRNSSLKETYYGTYGSQSSVQTLALYL